MQNDLPSAQDVPRSVVVDPDFDWQADARPNIPRKDTIVYEVHVKGLTRLHSDVPEPLRGTYLGLASQPIIAYLKDLGITTVELMPIQEFASEGILARAGQVNYWGYQPIGFFAPTGRYATRGGRGEQVREFKEMVKAFTKTGLEVILDVVYNHTAEEDRRGPTYSFRGLSNPSYYRLDELTRDLTGTGNTYNIASQQSRELVVDCLKYWVREMHVDGFRFDLAPVLRLTGTGKRCFNKASLFFEAVAADNDLKGIKLFAEPWAVNDDGDLYALGELPRGAGASGTIRIGRRSALSGRATTTS